jgi:Domain of unknown function (DUF5655)
MKREKQEIGWRCPACGRRFRQRTREHSCEVRSLDAHLARASASVQETLAALQDVLAAIGPHAVVPVKTMILLRATANFGSVVLRRHTLDLEFKLPRALNHARIHKSDRLGPRRYTHHTRLTSPGEVDAEIVGWLRESYEATCPS